MSSLLCKLGLHAWGKCSDQPGRHDTKQCGSGCSCSCIREGCGATRHKWGQGFRRCECLRFPCQARNHMWNGCQCINPGCGGKRDAQHVWDGCKCVTCGKERDEGHKWDGCKCSTCGKERDESHQWKDCKCSICRKTREQEHNWDGCRCAVCFKIRNQEHSWTNGRCSRCGKFNFSSLEEALPFMKQYESMEIFKRPGLISAITDLHASCDENAKRLVIQGLLDILRVLPSPPLDDATFSTICAAIAAFGCIGDDSSEVLDCLDSFVTRDPNYRAIEILGELAEKSDAALSRLLAWHRRVDKAQVAGYSLINIRRESMAIVDSFRRLLNDGRYDSYVQETARKFFDKHPQYK
ncbi:MAG: hypothetical protein WCI77_01790 [Candidatus Omnitrophota bacterium]